MKNLLYIGLLCLNPHWHCIR